MSFFKAIMTVGSWTLASRFLGFARDILTAAYLGAGPVADAFFVALKLPNFFRRITAEGAFSVSFVPLFARELEENGAEKARQFAQEAQAMMIAVLIPFTVIMILAMPWLIHVIAPGFADTPLRYDLAVELSRITFPYILFMSIAALLGGVMNSYNRFGAFAAAPMLFNLVVMAALIFLSPIVETGGHAMAWGVLAAGVVQLLWMIYACRKIGTVIKLRRPGLSPRIKKLFKKMGPGIFGASVMQVNLLIDMILASLLPVGAISFLYYADRLYQLPLSVIGIAIGTALLPMLTRALRGKEAGSADKLFRQGIDVSLILSLPAAAAYISVGVSIMAVLFERGAFTQADSQAAAYALMAYALGLPAFVLSKVFAVAFFAREDTSTPVKIAIVCAIVNTLVAIALIGPLGHVGIALATGIAAWINLALLVRALRAIKALPMTIAWKRCSKIIMAVAGMTLVLCLGDHFVMQGVLEQGQLARIFGLAAVLSAGAVVYGGLLYALGVVDAQMVKSLFPNRQKQATIADVKEYE